MQDVIFIGVTWRVGGTLVAEDAPGGGLTMAVSLPAAHRHDAGAGRR